MVNLSKETVPWWKSTNSKREWTLPDGKKIRQTTLEEWK